jgi:HlyD family secretion protein
MNTAAPVVSRKPFRKKKVFKLIAIILVIALLAGGAYYFVKVRNSKSTGTQTQRTSTVVKGQLTDSIAGSAPIESSNRSELSPKVTATLEKINVKAGDQVKAGEVLFVLDNTDALLNIQNAENSISQMQLTLDSTVKSVNGLKLKAPFNGQVTNISIKEGDTANKNGVLMTITDVSKLKVTLAFSGSEAENIRVGQTATVYLQDLMLSVDGKVTYKSSKPYAASAGGEIYTVEIQLDNPGSLKSGMNATAEITVGGATIDSVESGALSYIDSEVLKSDAGGTVTRLDVRENEFVNEGDTLVEMENDDLLLTSSTNNLKMENLKSQLEILQKQLGYYTITAPFDGTITKMGNANEGDTVKQGETLAILSDMNHLEFSVDIDELDISKLAVEQKVTITSDAIEETATTPLTGKVTNIAMEGTSSNGVTTYPVTITVDDESAAKLKTGMNIDAEIIIADKSDILMVPLEAVTKMGGRNFVYVKGTDSGSGGSQTGGSGGQGQTGGNGSWMGGNGGDGEFGPPADNTSGAGFRRRSDGNTSGAGFTGAPPTGNTSGAGFTGAPPTGSTSGAGFRTRRNGNTSGGAISGNWGGGNTGNTGNTSQSAVRGSFAKARNAGQDNYYEGAYMVEVQTGISNDSYIEITSGLEEGQTIVLPKTSTVKTTNSNSESGRIRVGSFSGGGGFGGGGSAPVGGGPGGF